MICSAGLSCTVWLGEPVQLCIPKNIIAHTKLILCSKNLAVPGSDTIMRISFISDVIIGR